MNNCPEGTEKISKNNLIICSEKIPENYYLDNGVYKECHKNCKTCQRAGNDANNNCDECSNDFSFLSDPFAIEKNCYKSCTFNYYFQGTNNHFCTENDDCPNNYKLIEYKKKCIDECKNNDDNTYIIEYQNKCVDKCEEGLKLGKEDSKCVQSCDNNKFEYNNECLISCPQDTFKIFQTRNRCTETIPENYYFNQITEIYNECYETCKTCQDAGTDSNSNCEECIDDYLFLNDSLAINKNCYKKCNYNYYFDKNNNNYCCTEDDLCPDNYKLIIQRNKCIE